MRKWNFGKCHRAAVFFGLCLTIIVLLTVAIGGVALNPRPAKAAVTFNPAYPANYDVWECQPFTVPAGGVNITSNCTGPPCPFPPGWWPPEAHFFWQWSGAWPGWLHLNPTNGELWGCPDVAAVNYAATIRCWSMIPNPTACTGWCIDFSDATVNFIVHPTAVACMTVDAVPIPLCWEGIPFNMTCTVTGGVGPYTWTATGLPVGLTMDAAGNITGAPAIGTCNTFNNVTVTVTDTGYCAGGGCPCPTSVNRTFILFVDCWANYIPIIFTTITTGCDQTVEIGHGLTQGQTNLLVDGAHVATLAGGQKYTITSTPCEGHTVMVDQTVQPNSNTKFTVIGSNIKTFSENDNYAFFDYAPEVNITTDSDPHGAIQPPGAGFYQVGGYFSSTVPGTIETDVANGKKLVFSEWQLPDGTTWQNVNLGYTVNQGGTVVARYKQYYRLRLHSDYPSVMDESWWPAGSNAQWDVAVPRVPALGFLGFFGVTQSARNGKGSQLINGPTDIPIQYEYNYWPLIISVLVILLLIAGIIFLVRWLRSRPSPQPKTKTGVKKKRTSRTRK
jgi:hypothetical protein